MADGGDFTLNSADDDDAADGDGAPVAAVDVDSS